MIDKIIDQVKKLSKEQIIEFAEEFNQVYEPIKNEIELSKYKSGMDKAVELGDKICSFLGVDAFPFSHAGKCLDSPYNPYAGLLNCRDILEWFYCFRNKDIELTKEQEKDFKALYKEFTTHIPKDLKLTKKDAEYQSPNWELFNTYGVGGNWDRIEEEVG